MMHRAKDIIITVAAAAAVSILGCGSGENKTAAGESNATTVAASSEAQVSGWSQGDQAFDFTLKDLAGNDVRLSDYKGKVVILDFWATWCGPCKMEVPHFKELHKQYQLKGVEIVGIALDQQGAKIVAPFIASNQIEYTTLIGTSEVVQRYGSPRGIPTTFVIDQNGKIVTSFMGYRSKDVFEAEIVKLLPQETVAPAEAG